MFDALHSIHSYSQVIFSMSTYSKHPVSLIIFLTSDRQFLPASTNLAFRVAFVLPARYVFRLCHKLLFSPTRLKTSFVTLSTHVTLIMYLWNLLSKASNLGFTSLRFHCLIQIRMNANKIKNFSSLFLENPLTKRMLKKEKKGIPFLPWGRGIRYFFYSDIGAERYLRRYKTGYGIFIIPMYSIVCK